MNHRVPITVRLAQFEGPLDLLLYLIKENELDIETVPMSEVTDQYLDLLQTMQEMEINIASEFLVLAATLIQWKSQALLPRPEVADTGPEEEGTFSEDDLRRQLLELKRFQLQAEDLRQIPLLGEDVFARPNSKPPIEKVWKDMDVSTLAICYQEMLSRARRRKQILKKETVSVAQKMAAFADRLTLGQMTALTDLLSAVPDRPEWVVTFLTALELGKLKKLTIQQEGAYQPIYVELKEPLKGVEAELKSEFDQLTAADTPTHEPTPAPIRRSPAHEVHATI